MKKNALIVISVPLLAVSSLHQFLISELRLRICASNSCVSAKRRHSVKLHLALPNKGVSGRPLARKMCVLTEFCRMDWSSSWLTIQRSPEDTIYRGEKLNSNLFSISFGQSLKRKVLFLWSNLYLKRFFCVRRGNNFHISEQASVEVG